MNYTEQHLDQIDAHLAQPGRNGGAPRISPEAFTDPSLKEAFHDVEMLWQASRLEKLQGKLMMLKQYEEEAKAEAKAKESKTLKVVSISKRRWVLSIAAGIALIAVAGWFLFRPQPVAIQNQYLAMHFNEYILHDVMKSDNTPGEYTPEQLRAYNLFAIQDFEKAIPLLKEQWEEKGDTMALFYLWVSCVALGDEQQVNQYKSDALSIKSLELQKKIQLLIE